MFNILTRKRNVGQLQWNSEFHSCRIKNVNCLLIFDKSRRSSPSLPTCSALWKVQISPPCTSDPSPLLFFCSALYLIFPFPPIFVTVYFWICCMSLSRFAFTLIKNRADSYSLHSKAIQGIQSLNWKYHIKNVQITICIHAVTILFCLVMFFLNTVKSFGVKSEMH